MKGNKIPDEIKQKVLLKVIDEVQAGNIKNVYQEYEYKKKLYKEEGYDWKSPIEEDDGLLVD